MSEESAWKDYADFEYKISPEAAASIETGNVCIKAFTSDEPVPEGKYRIVYDGNGSTSGKMTPEEVPCNEQKTLAKNQFSMQNHLFAGWNTDKDGRGTKYSDECTVSGEFESQSVITLYAQWEPFYYGIVFDPNGAPYDSVFSLNNLPSVGTVVLPICEYSYEGHSFRGWSLQSDGEGAVYESGKELGSLAEEDGETVVFYAIWDPEEYQISFDANGGTVSSSSKITAYNKKIGELPEAERENYIFLGWYTALKGGEKITSESVYNYCSDLTLYAHWQDAQNCVVTFDLKGGHMENAVETAVNVAFGETVQSIGSPVRANFTFLGWYLEGSDTVYDFNTPVTEDITLVAEWESLLLTAEVRSNFENNSELKKGDKIRLSCSTEGAVIYYTLDGSNPTVNSQIFKDYIEVTGSGELVVKAFAKKEGYLAGETLVLTYNILNSASDWGDLSEEDIAIFENADEVPHGLWVAGVPASTPYTGVAITYNNLRVYNNKTLLTRNKDYKLSYKNNTNAGTATITVTGLGNYRDIFTKSFSITPLELDAAKVSVPNVKYQNKKGAAFSFVTVLGINNSILKKGTDFTVTYTYMNETLVKAGSKNVTRIQGDVVASNDIVPCGTYICVTISGKGNYYTAEPIEDSYMVTEEKLTSISSSSVTIQAQEYTGLDIDLSGKIKVKIGSKILVENKDYKIAGYSLNHKDKGTATVTISGIYNPEEGIYYTGSKTVKFSIKAKTISSSSVLRADESVWEAEARDSYFFENSAIEPSVKIVDGETVLTEGVDYTVKYSNNTNATNGSKVPTVTISGKGNYSGSITRRFTITKTEMSACVISSETVYVTGKKDSYKVSVKVSCIFKNLKAGTDFKLSYYTDEACTKAVSSKYIPKEGDVYYCKVSGSGNFTGTYVFKVNLQAQTEITSENAEFYHVRESAVLWDDSSVVMEYNKSGSTPGLLIKAGEETLVAGRDYTLKVSNNKARRNYNQSKAPSITVTFKGKYKGTKTLYYSIGQADISKGSMTAADKVYSSSKNGFISAPVVTDANGNKLKSGTDYTVTYKYASDTYLKNGTLRTKGTTVEATDAPQVGTVIQAVVTGKGNYTGTITTSDAYRNSNLDAAYKIVAGSISKAKVSIGSQNYTGSAITLSKSQITVKVGSKTLSSSDFEIVSYSKNIAKGTAKVVIKGIGNYTGTKTATFKITQKSMYLTVVFNGNASSSGSIKSISIASGKSTTLPSFGFTRTGFVSDREQGVWNTKADGSGIYYDDGATLTNNGLDGETIVLYAQWKKASGPRGISVKKPEDATKAANQQEISWTPVSGAENYTVYRATSFNGTYTSIGTTANTFLSSTGLKDGTVYYYRVSANVKDKVNGKFIVVKGAMSDNYGKARTYELPNIKGKSYLNEFTVWIGPTEVPAVNVKIEVKNNGSKDFVLDSFAEGSYYFIGYEEFLGTLMSFADDNETVAPGEELISTWRITGGTAGGRSDEDLQSTFYAWYDGIYYECTLDTKGKFTCKAVSYK